MTGLLIGYAGVSTEEQDLTAQRNGLAKLGVEASRCYVDHASPAPTETGPVSAKRSQRAGPGTRWW